MIYSDLPLPSYFSVLFFLFFFPSEVAFFFFASFFLGALFFYVCFLILKILSGRRFCCSVERRKEGKGDLAIGS